MKASDLYGNAIVGGAKTQDSTQPVGPTMQQKDNAKQTATNQVKTGYGSIAIILLIGALVGAKFAVER